MENQLHTQASLQLLPLGYAPYPLASDSPQHQVIPCGYIQAALLLRFVLSIEGFSGAINP